MQNTCRTCRLGDESVFQRRVSRVAEPRDLETNRFSSREMRRRSFASKGSRAGEAERTSYEVAKWPQGAAFATSAKFWAANLFIFIAEGAETGRRRVLCAYTRQRKRSASCDHFVAQSLRSLGQPDRRWRQVNFTSTATRK